MMDGYKCLSLELAGIEKNLKNYSENSSAYNILPNLKGALETRDKDEILYCLDVIIDWYDKNINNIHSNQFCFNGEEHDRYFDLIKNIKNEIEEHDDCRNASDREKKNDKPLIFLSHRSSDKKYGDALEKFIVGLGVKNEQLIYTSHSLHKIPLDENIYEYLRKNINRDIFMIILWSDEYLNSPACLNELGASWVVQCDCTNVYVPQFSFTNPKYHECAVDTKKMGVVLNGDESCKHAMLELKDKILTLFGLSIDEAQIMYLIDGLINDIKEDE